LRNSRFLNWLRFALWTSFLGLPTISGSQIAVIGNDFFDRHFVRPCRQWVCFEPQRASGDGRIDACLFPPRRFITRAMDLAVMSPAERDGELIADLAAVAASRWLFAALLS
jgi:hypothetical protein